MSNSVNENINKVPVLGDLPIVGKYLFTQTGRQMEKKSLLVFIKPTIVRNPTDSNNITITKYDTVRRAQLNWPEDLEKTVPRKAPNVLPPWGNSVTIPKPFESSHP